MRSARGGVRGVGGGRAGPRGRRGRRRWLPALLALAAVHAAVHAAAAEAPGVEVFSPEGAARGVRQVTARFSAPMVALGDPRPAAPFEVDCATSGRGRWNDPRQWVYDFDRELPAGLTCRFALREGVATLAGEPLTGRREFALATGGPRVVASFPFEGDERIDERQVFLLAPDGPVDPVSLAAHAACEVAGVGERMPLEVLAGDAREAILAQRRFLGGAYDNLLSAVLPGAPEEALEDPETRARAEAQLVVARCQRPLPPSSEVRILWGRGVAAPGGLAGDQDQALAFRVRPEFTARLECERVNPRSGCLPMRPLRLRFSAPVPAGQAAQVCLRAADGRELPATPVAPEARPTVEWVGFPGPFPEETRLTLELPAGLTDDAGRPLVNAARFPLPVEIGPYPPLAKFPGNFGILERKAGAVLPVTLRNLEPEVAARRLPAQGQVSGKRLRITGDAEIARWLRRVEDAGAPRGEVREVEGEERWVERTGSTSVFAEAERPQAFQVPKPEGARAFEVVGIPLGGPGFHVVELASERLGQALLDEARPRYVATAALVTDLAVHLKWGREGSVVWVTTLDAAEPVGGAEVRMSEYCSGRELWRGQTDGDGVARVPAGPLPPPTAWAGCGGGEAGPLLVSARAGDDLAFVLSNWGEGIRPFDFNLPVGPGAPTRILHTVLDRPLFRAGETVSMKHFLRRATLEGIAPPETGRAPVELALTHRGSGQRYRLPVAFDGQGIAESRWPIPRDAKLGTYEVAFRGEVGGSEVWEESGTFRVEQFRVPSMRAVVQPPATPLVAADEVPVDLHVAYLAGGGAANLPVKLRSLARPAWAAHAIEAYPEFTFAAETVTEGLERSVPGGGLAEDEEGEAPGRPGPAQVLPLTLDGSGTARAVVTGLPAADTPRELELELEYPDVTGQLRSAGARVTLWPSAVRVGLKAPAEVDPGEPLEAEALAVDLDGRPVAGRAVEVEVYQRTTYSYRKRLVGGFYAYESAVETRRLAEAGCRGQTDARGVLACELVPGVEGQIVLRARAADDAGREAVATAQLWVYGAGQGWFGGTASDRMDLLPARAELEAGETARLQVRMPFRKATALVTVEREGVMDAFVTRLTGGLPVVEVPVRAAHAPNAFVSVLAVRGRLAPAEGGAPTALVDLAKPAYRLGMAELRVGWRPQRLEVQVTPDAEVHRVRERARVRVAVRRADGGPLPEGAEVALAAVDEGLLELAPNPSWDLLERMMAPRGVEVFTATAQMQVVGKRHYGRKALPTGGGGGRAGARELFDTLLVWQGRVPLSAAGEAEVEVPLNDSLTAFRVVAVASAGAGHFGTGSGAIRTTQDLMLHAGLPPVVREGDRFQAVFTARNATDRPLAGRGSARVTALGAAGPGPALAEVPLTLAPGAGEALRWEVEVPAGTRALEWEVVAEAGEASDRLRVRQEVRPVHPVRVHQATLGRLDPALEVPVERPAGARPGRGGVRVALADRLTGGLGGVKEHMAAYPYTCLEQRVSRAVALGDREAWDLLMRELPAHLDRDGLLRYFPGDRLAGSDSLTAYVLSLAAAAGWPLPEAERGRLTAGLAGFLEGRVQRRSALATADLTVRRVAALAALVRHGPVAPELLAGVRPDPELWPTATVVDWLEVLERMPELPGAAGQREATLTALRARLRTVGTQLALVDRAEDRLPWLMVSPDLAALRLLALASADPAWRADLPALVRGALARQRAGHWGTTPANAWGVLALARASAALEEGSVAGTTEARLGGETVALAWGPEPPAAADLPWPEGPSTLALDHRGEGRPWARVETRAALPLEGPVFAGYRVRRTVTPVEQKTPGAWTRGDVARVRLDLEADADMAWVVVDAPIPAGATLLGSGLGGDSALLTRGEDPGRGAWPAYVERALDAVRAYYDFVPAGPWSFEYTIRFDNPGRFELPPTRVEALYAPEVHAELPGEPVTVQ